jgi:hypothetical protein
MMPNRPIREGPIGRALQIDILLQEPVRFGHSAATYPLSRLETKASYAETPLSWAVASGHEAVVKLLLEKGAELETKGNYYGQTPLSLAAGSRARGSGEAAARERR